MNDDEQNNTTHDVIVNLAMQQKYDSDDANDEDCSENPHKIRIQMPLYSYKCHWTNTFIY